MCGSCQAPVGTSGLVPGPGIGEFLGHHATEACYKLAIVSAECSELLLVWSAEKYQVTFGFLLIGQILERAQVPFCLLLPGCAGSLLTGHYRCEGVVKEPTAIASSPIRLMAITST
jgi:hypothetical protein